MNNYTRKYFDGFHRLTARKKKDAELINNLTSLKRENADEAVKIKDMKMNLRRVNNSNDSERRRFHWNQLDVVSGEIRLKLEKRRLLIGKQVQHFHRIA